MTLVPIFNLEKLSEEEKRTYLIQVCEYFGIPSHLNLLEFLHMDGGDGAQHLVLYAKKGATDLLRDKREISVVELKENITKEFAMFTATGRDKTGRTEIAVGVADLVGFAGRELANRIMVAQTRATRRMTLQFVGGGFLDESEVQQVTTNLNSTSASISDLARQTHPQPSAGESKIVRTPEQIAAQETLDKMDKGKLAVAAGEVPETSTTVPEKSTKKLRRSSAVNFSLDEPKSPNADILESKPTVTPVDITEIQHHENGTDTVEHKREPDIKPAKISTTHTDAMVQAMESATFRPADEPAIQPDIPTNLPTAEQMKDYRARLLVFTEKTLPAAGMVPTEGLGGVTTKIRMFAMLRYKVTDIKKMTIDQWNEFLNYLESAQPAELVTQIDKTVTGK